MAIAWGGDMKGYLGRLFGAGSAVGLSDGEIQALLHDEVHRLPAKYRAPVVLCYFEGRTHDEAAAALGCPVGTVRGRLARARDRLRAGLTRRGLTPGGWLGAALSRPSARIEPSARLLEATVASTIHGKPGAAVGAMANLMLRGLNMARLTMTAAVLSIALSMAGFGLAPRGEPAARDGQQPDPSPAAVPAAGPRSTASDHAGESLPAHALSRFGSSRFHHGTSVVQALYTPDGKSLVAIDADAIVRIWDATSGRVVGEIGDSRADSRMARPSREIALSPDGKTLAIIDQPGGLCIWDLSSRRERRRWHQPRDAEYSHPAFSPDGRTVALGLRRFDESSRTTQSAIGLWDTTAPTEHHRLIPGDWVRLWDLKFSPDGRTLATATTDTEIMRGNTLIGPGKVSTRLWDLSTGRVRAQLPIAGPLTFSPDGSLLAVAATDGTVRLYNQTTGLERLPRPGPEPVRPPGGNLKTGVNRPPVIGRLAFSPDASILAGGDSSVSDASLAAIHIWDVASGGELCRMPAHQQGVGSLSFAPDGKVLASTGAEPVIRRWNAATGREVPSEAGPVSSLRSLAISRADGSVFIGADDGTVRRWNPSSGRDLGLIGRLVGPVEALVVAPDGETLLVVGLPEAQPGPAVWISLWSVAEHREIRRLAPIGDSDALRHVACSPDGKAFACEGRIRDARTGDVIVTLRHEDPTADRFFTFCPVFYTPDGRQVITAEPDGVRVWDAASGREVRLAVRWSNQHDRATLSPDGRFLATRGPSQGGSGDPPIILWELASGQEAATLEAHGEDILCRPFSPDGRFLASSGGHRGTTHASTVRVRDLATGREVRRFAGHRGAVTAVAFSPDGRSVVSASEDATALVWDISDLTDPAKPSPPLDAGTLKARWDELASDDARVAYRATWALSVPPAVAFLRDHLRPAPASVPMVNDPIASPEDLRILRAVTALERIGAPEARTVLESMARGNPAAITTRDARLALDRLSRSTKAQAGTSPR